MDWFIALLIGAAAGIGLGMSQLKLSLPQHLGIAGVAGGLAGVLANALLGGILAALFAFIGNLAVVAVAGGAVVYAAKQAGLFK
ncbi:MAG: hypothetical protein HC933_03165 [Pleurocapsa sp. SU_196_0]|nr:hypothetical protein [Pleurocapsa sp. SU_196_0]